MTGGFYEYGEDTVTSTRVSVHQSLASCLRLVALSQRLDQLIDVIADAHLTVLHLDTFFGFFDIESFLYHIGC